MEGVKERPITSYDNSVTVEQEVKRLQLQRLLIVNNKSINESQWKGRVVCLLKGLQTIPRELWRMVKQSIVAMAAVAITIHELLQFKFKDFWVQVKGTANIVGGLVLRPVSLVKESGHYFVGAIIDPKLVEI